MVYCNQDNCIYCFEGECQRTSIVLEKVNPVAFFTHCISTEIKSPAGAITPSKALEK